MKKVVLILVFCLIAVNCYASPYIEETISAHQMFDVNDDRYLKLGGDNANQTIDIGKEDLTTTGTLSGNTVTATTAVYIDSTRYDKNFNTQVRFWDGSFLEFFNALVTSDGSTITMTLDNANLYEPELTMNFSDGYSKIASGSTVALTAGSTIAPQANYIYIPQSTKVLTKSTSAFPTTAEHIKIGYFLVASATYVRADGAYINQNWNDSAVGTDNQGHMLHLGERSRRFGARYFSGVGPNGNDGAASSYFDYVSGTEAYFKSAAGVIYQMHQHVYPAKDTRTDDIHVVNERAAGAGGNGAYWAIHDLTDIDEDTGGTTLTNRYFNLTFFGVANKSGEYGPIMCNLPTGSYANQSSAENDVSGYDVLSMPREFNLESSTGFLIARITFKNTAGNWSHISTVDLRGSTPATATGGASGVATNFADNQFTIFDESDTTKIAAFDVGTAVATGTTRTLKFPNASGYMVIDDKVCTDLEGTGLSITGGTLNASATGDPAFVGWTQDNDAPNYTLSPVTGNTVSASTITGTTVTGITVYAPQLWIGGGTNRYLMPTTAPPDNYIPKYDALLRRVMWEVDADTGGAPSIFVGWTQDNDAPAFTLSPVTGNTVSATTVIGTTVTATTVTANTVDAWTVRMGDLHSTIPHNDTIQFTVEQPDQIDTSTYLTFWENESDLTFNITKVKGRSDTPYNFVIGMMTSKGEDQGIVVDYGTKYNNATAEVPFSVSQSTVSWSTITNSTVLYFNNSDWAPNHCKVTIKGYYN